MKMISAHRGLLQTLSAEMGNGLVRKGFRTELAAFDDVVPHHCIASGAVHELLTERCQPSPTWIATLLARAASRDGGSVVWSDPHKKLYPPALADAGISLDRLIVLQPKNLNEELWAIAECLRCKAVRVTVAEVSRLTSVQARQLQLAAERGGGIGLLLRRVGKESAIYAAATRWMICPLPGDKAAQRWKMELIHGHGGRVGDSVVLEVSRESNHVRAFPFVEYSAHQAQAERLPA